MLKTLKLSVFFGLLIAIFVLAQANVLATSNESEDSDESVSTTAVEKRAEKKTALKTAEGEDENENENEVEGEGEDDANSSKVRKNNLSQARLKICQSREDRISSRFTNLLSLGARSHQNFDGFVARVDYFYLNILVVKGFTLENYDALKADIALREAAVKSALEQVRASGQDFSCDSEDPKAQTDTFRQNMQVLINANKAYKTSVRTFIAAVRDLAKEAKSATLSPSPEVSPEAEESPVVSETQE